ncbi:hypothetical protein RB195_001332 [Necator americanus]|uniref:Uncharacterized protein n=1 Tax=Necator americanus TaxID=51031 RepID=A0ABR1DDV4_NECAM
MDDNCALSPCGSQHRDNVSFHGSIMSPIVTDQTNPFDPTYDSVDGTKLSTNPKCFGQIQDQIYLISERGHKVYDLVSFKTPEKSVELFVEIRVHVWFFERIATPRSSSRCPLAHPKMATVATTTAAVRCDLDRDRRRHVHEFSECHLRDVLLLRFLLRVLTVWLVIYSEGFKNCYSNLFCSVTENNSKLLDFPTRFLPINV